MDENTQRAVLLGKINSSENELYEAIIDCGKYLSRNGNVEIIRPYLDHASPEIRSAAIFALAFYWRVPEFEETAKQMFYSENDEDVKIKCLSAWCSYYWLTNDKNMIETLIKIVRNPDTTEWVKRAAYHKAFSVSKLPKNEHPDMFSEEIDLNLLDKIIEIMNK